MLALAATGALALTAATALAPGGPVVVAQAAVLSAAPSPAQAETLPLPEMLRDAAPAAVAAPAVGVPATAAPSAGLSFLDGVFCTSRTRCWAVGGQYGAGGVSIANQALHWNGKRWRVVRTPDPGGNGSGKISELEDSTCITSADCWAVGDFGSGTEGPTEKRINQVLHWNGKKWSRLR
jgi:hypothetical protein